jgi:hypothetical protein
VIPSAKPPQPAEKLVQTARELAQATAAILPEGFDRVLPRGYSMSGSTLLMARFEIVDMRGQALYARHTAWGPKESQVFVRDLKEGWLDELSSFMRWQLRADPPANAIFQHALVHLKDDANKRLLVTPGS